MSRKQRKKELLLLFYRIRLFSRVILFSERKISVTKTFYCSFVCCRQGAQGVLLMMPSSVKLYFREPSAHHTIQVEVSDTFVPSTGIR